MKIYTGDQEDFDDEKTNNNDFESHSDTESGDAIIESSLILRHLMFNENENCNLVEPKDHSCDHCGKSFSNKLI